MRRQILESWWKEPEPAPHFLLTGHFEEGRCVSMLVTREAACIPRPVMMASGHVVQLLSADGRVLAEGEFEIPMVISCPMPFDDDDEETVDEQVEEPVTIDEPATAVEPDSQQAGKREVRGIDAAVPIVEGGVTLVVREGEHTLWTRHAPTVEPRVVAITSETVGNTITLRWTDEVSDDDHYAIQVSCSQALRSSRFQWDHEPVTRSVRRSGGRLVGDREFTLDSDDYAPGPLALTVSVSDGFHQVESEAHTVIIPSRPPTVNMGGVMLEDGVMMAAWLQPSRRDIVSPEEVEYVWFVDGVEAARGERVILPYPPPGSHEVMVEATWQGHVVRRALPMAQRRVESAGPDT